MQNIEELSLCGNFSYLNLDNLVNLKKLYIQGTINKNFNFKLFKNLCKQLEDLSFCFKNVGKIVDAYKLFDGHHFSNLLRLRIMGFNKRKVTKKFLKKFPMLRELTMQECNIEKFEDYALSSLKYLICLDLANNLLEKLDIPLFWGLPNLEYLNLRYNRIKCIQNVFLKLNKLQKLDLSNNRLDLLDSESCKVYFPWHINICIVDKTCGE